MLPLLLVLLHPGFEPFAPHQLAPAQSEVSQLRKAVNPAMQHVADVGLGTSKDLCDLTNS